MEQMRAWKDGKWELVTDTRPRPPKDKSYDDWMADLGYMSMQVFGNPDGYHYELWASHRDDGEFISSDWIVSLSDGKMSSDIEVKTLLDLADLMSHLGPGAVASCMDGQEMSAMWGEMSGRRETMELMGKAVQNAVAKVTDSYKPCDCPRCLAEQEREKASRQSKAN